MNNANILPILSATQLTGINEDLGITWQADILPFQIDNIYLQYIKYLLVMLLCSKCNLLLSGQNFLMLHLIFGTHFLAV